MFERGSRALAVVIPHAAGLYACPLCLLGFSVDEIEDGGRLTKENALRTSSAVLWSVSPADCNHRAGRVLDSQMVQAERLLDFAAGRDTPELRARLSLNGVEQRGRTRMDNGSVKFFGVPRVNSLNTTKAIQVTGDTRGCSVGHDFQRDIRRDLQRAPRCDRLVALGLPRGIRGIRSFSPASRSSASRFETQSLSRSIRR